MKCGEKFILGAILLCSAASLAADCSVTPYFSPRSQGVNAARQMVGWEELINLCDKGDSFYCAVAGVLEYTSTFRSQDICQCLFGEINQVTDDTETVTANSCSSNECDDDCNDCFISIAGSCVTDRGANAWMADYFGLPTDYVSTISFSPRVTNFVADIQFYAGLNDWVEGMYFRLHAPITYTKWNLRVSEDDITAGTSAYAAGYFSGQAVPRTQLNETALDFFSGCSVPNLTTGQVPSVKFQPLQFSKWSCDSLTKTRFADITAILGYNFLCSDCGFWGINLRVAAPTGNKPNGEYLFEPIAGNGQHWTLGVGMNAHYVFWKSQCNNSQFGFYLDANISHLFANRQIRSFDLCEQGNNSRYMLAQKLEGASNLFGNTDGGAAATNQSNLQFANEFAPVANLTASKVNVRISAEGEVAFKLAYLSDCGLTWDLGYNFWGKTRERISPTKCCKADLSQWALKGDAYVYGFVGTVPVALGATESEATLYAGTADNSCNNSDNDGIDNSQFAVRGTPLASITSAPNGEIQTHTSIQPITLDTVAINYASNRGISNKLFTNFSYMWTPCEDYTPFIGVGASVEFGQHCSSGCADSCEDTNDSCSTNACAPVTGCSNDVSGTSVSCALSQWAIWIKGGVSFN